MEIEWNSHAGWLRNYEQTESVIQEREIGMYKSPRTMFSICIMDEACLLHIRVGSMQLYKCY